MFIYISNLGISSMLVKVSKWIQGLRSTLGLVLVCRVDMLPEALLIFVLSLKRISGHRLHPSKDTANAI